MALTSPLLIEDSHQIGAFDSGVPALDDWVKRRARANQASGAAATSLVVAAAKKLVAEKRDEERLALAKGHETAPIRSLKNATILRRFGFHKYSSMDDSSLNQ
jgi:hypothetical protein